MDALTIIIMLILFVIAMIFVFSTALLTPYLGKKNLISVILLGFIVGAVGGAFLLSPIVDDIPDFSRTIIEENVEGTDEISMGLSTNRNITQTIENISSISGVNNVAYTGIEIRMDEEFDSPSSESRFLSVLQNSNDAIDEVTDMGENNTYFVKIKENGDPQSVLNSIYAVFGSENYIHLRYTSMDANATVDANNVTKIMNAITDNGVIIHNVTGPTEDQVKVVNDIIPNQTDVVIIAAVLGVIVAIVGFFIDSLFSMFKKSKKSKESTREQIKRKSVPASQRRKFSTQKNQPSRDSIDIFNDESFENSKKQNLGSNRNFKQLTDEDLKERQKQKDDGEEPKSKKSIKMPKLRSKSEPKRRKVDEIKGAPKRKAPKFRPKQRK